MTISQGRPIRYRRERAKRHKMFANTYMTVLALALIVVLITCMSITYLYYKTKTWSNSQNHQQLSTLAPEYVTNFPDNDLTELSNWSSRIGEALKKTENKNAKPNDVEKLLNDAKDFVKNKNIKSGTLLDDIDRLQIYVDYYNTIETSITNPDIDKFKAVYINIQNIVIKSDRDFDKSLIKNMQDIIGKYDKLANVVNNEIPKYGHFSGNKFKVNSDVTDLSPLINSLRSVSEFPPMQTFLDEIESNQSKVVTNNKELALKNTHDEIMKLVDKLNGLYVQRSTVQTYKDVVKNGWKVDGTYKDDDKVVEIRYNNSRVNDSDWIRLDIQPEIIMEKPPVDTISQNQNANEYSTDNQTTDNHSINRRSTGDRSINNHPTPSANQSSSTITSTTDKLSESTRSRTER